MAHQIMGPERGVRGERASVRGRRAPVALERARRVLAARDVGGGGRGVTYVPATLLGELAQRAVPRGRGRGRGRGR